MLLVIPRLRVPLLFLALVLLVSTSWAADLNHAGAYFDPGFQFLLKTEPRDAEVIRPMVPRISAGAAFALYKSGGAVFIAAGGAAIDARLPGAIPLTEALRLNPSPLKGLGKPIVLFCH